MDKLIQYLNEYEDWIVSWVKEYSEEFGVFILNTEQMMEEEIIISKSFGFIKWLVDNDKIDFDKIYSKTRIYTFGKGVSDTDYVIMILSIQDNPIEFLVSILK